MWNVLFTRYFDSWLLEQSNELQERVLAALLADREFTSYLLSIREDHENTSTSYR
ncbi:hypothetical protein [Proteus sp. CD3]|uniref:hypothetical protein n=1 Tax=Proteus sp. CD3 TaxID=1921565 RepID=UPI00223FFD66|nr:hypothetical protein [Proteus sp. CD3]